MTYKDQREWLTVKEKGKEYQGEGLMSRKDPLDIVTQWF